MASLIKDLNRLKDFVEYHDNTDDEEFNFIVNELILYIRNKEKIT